MEERDFNCQRCNLGLKLHSSLTLPILVSLQELINEKSCSDLNNLESYQDLSKIDPSFQQQHSQTHQFDVAAKLFDILTEQTDIDHPLCQECAQFILDQMDNQLLQLESECKESRRFAQAHRAASTSGTSTAAVPQHSTSSSSLSSSPPNYPTSAAANAAVERSSSNKKCDIEELNCEIARLAEQERELIEQLKQLDADERAAEQQIQQVQQEKEAMRVKNQDFWAEYNSLKHQLFQLDDELLSAENQIAYFKQRKEKLNSTNVLNTTFHIWHTGQFATINGFRLGRLPKEQVGWDEINAAWGQCVLLLHCLAKRIGLKFERYKLVPYGNNSFLECLDNKSRELPLYVSGGFMFIWTTKFDQAMAAYLDCLQQFKEQIERDEPNFKLPYKMEHGKVIDSVNGYSFSIKMQTNSEEQWTKALKFMLTNLKWSLAYVVSNYS